MRSLDDKIRVDITSPNSEFRNAEYFEPMEQWCRDNIQPDDWDHSNTTWQRRYYFSKEEDAMMFILRWK